MDTKKHLIENVSLQEGSKTRDKMERNIRTNRKSAQGSKVRNEPLGVSKAGRSSGADGIILTGLVSRHG